MCAILLVITPFTTKNVNVKRVCNDITQFVIMESVLIKSH